MKKLIAATILATAAMSAHAVPLDTELGYSDVSLSGGGNILTFTFDTLVNADIHGDDNGIFFSGYGLELTVTGSSNPLVIQDGICCSGPGGLGVDDANPLTNPAFDDNMGNGEWLTFTFNQEIDLMDINLNGLLDENGHQDAASGNFSYSTGATTVLADADLYDGVGTDAGGSISDNLVFNDIYSFSVNTLSLTDWHGYVGAITVRTVPEPSVLALLAMGLVGLGFAGRRKLS